MVRRSFAAGLALAVSIVLAACGGGTSKAPSTAPSSAPSTQPSEGGAVACEPAAVDADFVGDVTIKDFSMSPDPVSIKVGEAVAWTNEDSAPHTATLDDVDCSTDSIANGTTAKLVFHVAGTYTYHCEIHPGQMTGYAVEVTE